MQKKVIGILAGVAAAHAVLLVGLMASGGCRQPEILGPHTYDNGPELGEVPGASEQPGVETEVSAPKIPGGESAVAPALPPMQPHYPESTVSKPAGPVSTPGKGTSTYKVKAGDTLSKIAYAHGVRTRDLAACNNLSGKAMNTIRVGQELTIPDGGSYHAASTPKSGAKSAKPAKPKSAKSTKTAKPAAALPADGVYVVVSGDSLDKIGRRYGVTAKAIAQENNIALNKMLHIGDKLRIPGKTTAAAAPVAAPGTTPLMSTEGTTLPATAGNDLDPNMGLTPDSAATTTPAAPAAGNAGMPEAAAPATQLVAPPAAQPAASVNTEALEVSHDMTVDEFCKLLGVKPDELKRLNPELPADGKLKGGTYLVVPQI